MGVFEKAPFAAGTSGVARAVVGGSAFSVIGGGDTIAAVNQAGVADRIGYISTAGGAFLEFLEGRNAAGRRGADGGLMRTPLVVGNWKMNGTLAESRVLAGALREGLKRPRGVEVVVCPPFTALPAVAEILGLGPIMLGGQNCHHEASGAHTGEISPPMLVELGCRFVILGHSERRREMGETDEQINRKVGAASAARPHARSCASARPPRSVARG